MPRLEIVQEDAQRVPPRPTDLDSFGIHHIFRREAFRHASYLRYTSLGQLDERTYDLSQVVYDRMKPALRLASLFVRYVMPQFARIGSAEVREYVHPDGYTYKALTDDWEYDPVRTARFESNDLLRLCTNYRFTLLTTDHFARSLCDAHDELAVTSALLNHVAGAPFDPVYPQTALNSSWIWYLAREDWDTISTEEKYSKYFMFATTLVHELAHAVWINRVYSGVRLKSDKNEEIALVEPEPSYFPDHDFAELGCAIELELFHSLPGFPHFGTPTTTERACSDEPHKVLFTLLDAKGRAIDIHQASTSTIYSFFDPRVWAMTDFYFQPDYVVELLENRRPPRRRLSTSLSDPRFLEEFDVPVLSEPFPGMLKPAITADNELFG
ncbi:uncharacterized protein Z520_06268 [Fonsecaea multimorphosa CBS 102226]|uniref:Uncharacterized protein n=1 Tax=Fonsecaea multimorphosa CBS 102226 TaxID=1442371 RepID=A0A0D2KN83_9EURO|nr:uncharacterized protein Z520_06268 [Fonsecaea multimorphosa CBS 102226]KIX98188.1 hypothetical protein Z520_06268 [Fonsecaea multimorphosa CBS 102226]OAL24263.1 hypothetical protein AYO22_05923 [Fonsecaea multimorphosa]